MSSSEYQIETESMALPTVAIVGRPNVGKSALFNRIIKRKMAIVHSQSGVTRDRVAALARWNRTQFICMDTGGLGIFLDEKNAESVWDERIREQIQVALDSADKVIFVVDITEDILPLDQEVARLLKQSDKDVILACNKADDLGQADKAEQFASLGFDNIIPISCLHKHGLDRLMNDLTADFPLMEDVEDSKALNLSKLRYHRDNFRYSG